MYPLLVHPVHSKLQARTNYHSNHHSRRRRRQQQQQQPYFIRGHLHHFIICSIYICVIVFLLSEYGQLCSFCSSILIHWSLVYCKDTPG